jgi:SAM-dependent methyltransferase
MNMNWKLKAKLQNLIAVLPEGPSYALYYFIQRRFGRLAHPDPLEHLSYGTGIAQLLKEQGLVVMDKTFLEVGTGRRVGVPLALWLSGASRIITVDLNPYLKSELVFEMIAYMRNHKQEMESLFASHSSVFAERFSQLCAAPADLSRLLALANIEYMAPADAAHLDLSAHSVDYHISYAVFEHIPPEILANILEEGKRLLKPDGIFLHAIDLSDHFSHTDESVSPLNFLRYSDEEWAHLAGNRYMYQNRLRIDDFRRLFQDAHLNTIYEHVTLRESVLEELKRDIPINPRFQGKSLEANAATNCLIIAGTE